MKLKILIDSLKEDFSKKNLMQETANKNKILRMELTSPQLFKKIIRDYRLRDLYQRIQNIVQSMIQVDDVEKYSINRYDKVIIRYTKGKLGKSMI
ncbi:unnamed protein product [Paramecium primaurelia]|uniref:Uncharacterized protein n=1 Tax=Paramecium primaurelia TaxID=5886 RepID=A0A8S1Q7P1_PARPR|nr:unnamed protein product [Paramecium primaurelia]